MFKFFGDCLADASDTLLEMSGVEDLSSTLARRRPGGDPLAVREAPVGEMLDGELRHIHLYPLLPDVVDDRRRFTDHMFSPFIDLNFRILCLLNVVFMLFQFHVSVILDS